MKSLISAFACFALLPAMLEAQYSNASLNGPWIAGTGNSSSYIIFDGNGNISSLGTKDDLVCPVGIYSVQSNGNILATLTLAGGMDTVTGTLTSATTATIYINGNGPFSLSGVTNIAALTDTFSGTVYDSSSQVVKNIDIAIDFTGSVSTVSGDLSEISGRIFSEHNVYAGFFTTTDTACAWQKMQWWGSFYNNSLQGPAKLGGSDSCGNQGSVFLMKKSTGVTGITSVSRSSEANIYPNPSNGLFVLNGLQAGNNYDVTITDLQGRVVERQTISGTAASIPFYLEGVSSGLYILHAQSSSGSSTNLRLVKE